MTIVKNVYICINKICSDMILNYSETFKVNGKVKKTNFEPKIKKGIKIHSIRADVHDRWKVGMSIQHSHGARTKNYRCFGNSTCEGIQKVEIYSGMIFIDGEEIKGIEVWELAKNDGFDTVEDFWGWFGKEDVFIGKIIHWTNKIY